jgi:heme-degrading monooxygenase HmoA
MTEKPMIARIWHGRVLSEKSAAYRAFLVERAIPDYRSTPGNQGVYVLEQSEGETTHFVTFTLWDSPESVREFAGDDLERAKYYPEDDDYLLEKEPRVRHYRVVGSALGFPTIHP